MKSTRRHELQQNVLDAELGKGIEFLKKNANRIITVVLVVLIVVAGWMYWKRRAQTRMTEVQMRYDNLRARAAMPETKGRDVINGFLELSEQDTLRWIAADSLLELGGLYSTRVLSAAKPQGRAKPLAEARKYYQRVIDNFQDHPPAVAAAHFALGKLAEGQGQFDAAGKEYKAVLAMENLDGYPILDQARRAEIQLAGFREPIRMATTLPAWAEQKDKADKQQKP